MELVLIRHAQPAWTETGAGRLDPDLTELGHHQASALAAWLAHDDPFDELLVTTATRAKSTAAPVATTLGLKAIDMPDLIECGMANGHEVPEVATLPPIPGWDQGYKGERFDRFHHRITGGLQRMLTDRGVEAGARPGWWQVAGEPRRTLLVAHGGTNSIVTAHLLGLEPIPQPWDRFITPHTAVSRFAAYETDRGWVFALRSFADVSHLGDIAVTV